MKTSAPYLSRITAAVIGSCTAFVAPSLLAQTTATTDPVGFITLAVDAAAGGSSKISFKGLGMTRPVEYQGSAEAVSANSLTDNDATWTDNQFNGANGAYFVEVTSGAAAGRTSDITATNAATKTITVSDNLGAAAGAIFKIRKHWTIGSVFGANNESGLAGGDSPTTADQVLIWNGAGYDTYYYQVAPPAAGGTGWRSAADAFASAANQKVYPDDGVIVKRIQNTAVNVVLMGAVKTGQTSVPVQPGVNIIGNVYAAPFTLASSGLQASGLTGGDAPTTSDQVLIWNGVGYDTYYYQVAPPAAGGTGWRSAADAFADAGATQVAVGTSIIVKRNLGAAFNWIIPQHPATI